VCECVAVIAVFVVTLVIAAIAGIDERRHGLWISIPAEEPSDHLLAQRSRIVRIGRDHNRMLETPGEVAQKKSRSLNASPHSELYAAGP
jgi:hypothetical protein